MSGIFNFPSPDPIPLPAPVWLFKALHGTVLSLHFVTVQLVLGWLLVGLIWNFWGRARADETMVAGSSKLARSLPVVMTYLINLGIPPFLFVQVLYGNFIYTSSVLIGAWWISVVFLVILLYSLLYVANNRSEASKPWWPWALFALLVGLFIAKIYSTNMTLMLRPEIWEPMFRANARGGTLPQHDPTLLPRWLFMVAGALTMGGLGLVATGIWRRIEPALKALMVGQGGGLAAVGAALQLGAALMVFNAQPAGVTGRLAANAFYQPVPTILVGLAGAVVALGIVALLRREKSGGVIATLATLLGVLFTAAAVVYRDGIRDATLALQGYDVWNQKVVENWPIVALFLAVFVAGVLILGWMTALAFTSKPLKKESLS